MPPAGHEYVAACRLDVAVLKPGNVSHDAPGHDMTGADFETSARVSAGPIAAAGAALGDRIYGAVAATRAAAGCNTNLGIVLAAAPLVAAAERGAPLEPALAGVLASLDARDAAEVYRAIALAAPGGLGRVEHADVHDEPPESLLEAMALAADRDRIARLYVTDFEDVFRIGVPAFDAGLARWGREHAAVQWTYLTLLGSFEDSHVARKFGHKAAESLMLRGREVASQCKACENPDDFQPLLVAFDREVKGAEANPGTTADLTVASVLARRLSRLR